MSNEHDVDLDLVASGQQIIIGLTSVKQNASARARFYLLWAVVSFLSTTVCAVGFITLLAIAVAGNHASISDTSVASIGVGGFALAGSLLISSLVYFFGRWLQAARVSYSEADQATVDIGTLHFVLAHVHRVDATDFLNRVERIGRCRPSEQLSRMLPKEPAVESRRMEPAPRK